MNSIQKLLLYILAIFVLHGCGRNDSDFVNFELQLNRICALDISCVNSMQYCKDENFNYVNYDQRGTTENCDVEPLRRSIDSLINEQNFYGFEYSKKQFKLFNTNALNGYLYYEADYDSNVYLGDYYISLNELIKNGLDRKKPFAKRIKSNWFWLELSFTI